MIPVMSISTDKDAAAAAEWAAGPSEAEMRDADHELLRERVEDALNLLRGETTPRH
jgi:hypothetical protein